MRLARVTVTNFRSILAAESFKVGDYTVLVGPNNEGKSNLMRAMVMALDSIHSWSLLTELPSSSGVDHRHLRTVDRPGLLALSSIERRARHENFYRWERDFPLSLQDRVGSTQQSRVRLDFELDESEVESFKNLIGSANNGKLPIELLFGLRTVRLSVVKQGPGAKVLASKSLEVARLVASNLQMFSIPTARTEQNVLAVIQSLVSRQLRQLNSAKEYRDAVAVLDRLRSAAVQELQESVKSSLMEYLADVRSVELSLDSVAEQSMRVDDLLVDDGVSTSIAEKGDGVKSLTAISLMQQAARDSTSSLALIAAIDEPEAHLHPDAIHKLKSKLLEIASTQQVIVSTHAPVLVNRGEIGANIVVAANRAQAAKSLVEVRRALGVRLADNLSHAELVLLVEGSSDEQALREVLGARSRTIKRALADSTLAFIAMRGMKRLHTELLSQRNNVCRAFVIADNDDPARTALQAELQTGLLAHSDLFVLRREGGDSELEDFYLPALAQDAITEVFGVVLPMAVLQRRNHKWSTRVSQALQSAGKLPTEESIAEVKAVLASRVVAEPTGSIAPDTLEVIDALVLQIEAKLQSSD